MKTLLIVITATLFSTAAFAQDPAPRRDYTVDEINSALAFRGQPPLGSSRVLHDDRKSIEHESKYVTTVVSTGDTTDRTSTYRSR